MNFQKISNKLIMPLMGPKSAKKARDLRTRLSSSDFQAERSRALWRSVTRTEEADYDLELICAGNERVRCHQFVLASASRFLYDLIRSNCPVMPDSSLRSDTPLVISLPEAGGYGVRGLLSMLYNGFTEFPPLLAESGNASQIKETFKLLRVDVVKLNDRNSVKVVNMEEFSDSAQYQERKSFEKQKIPLSEPVKKINKSTDIISSIDEALELEEISPQTPARKSPDTPKAGEQRKTVIDIVETPKATPTSSRKRKSSPVGGKASQTVRGKETSAVQSEKKSRIIVRGGATGVAYSVEEIHTCVICNGKTPEGRIDREASNLSFGELKRLKEHYSKHFYTEGKVFKAFPPDEENLDSEGKIIDEVKWFHGHLKS